MSESQEDLQQRIAAYIDGELPPAEAARLEVYLANTDPALADTLVGMLADKVQIRALPKTRAPADLSARIMETIERGTLLHDVEHLSAPQRRWWQGRAAIAAGLVLVLGGFGYFVASSVFKPKTQKEWQGGSAARSETAPQILAQGPAGAATTPGVMPAMKDGMGGVGAATTSSDTPVIAKGPNIEMIGAPGGAPAMPVQSMKTFEPTQSNLGATDLATGGSMPVTQDRQLALAQEQNTRIGDTAPPGGFGGAEQTQAAGGFGGGGGGGGRGAAAGRGGRGGGRGGGGGGAAGAGAAAPTVMSGARGRASPAIAVAILEEGLKALQAVADKSPETPMVITFFEEAPDDYNRLGTVLNKYAFANSADRATLANNRQNANLTQNGGQNGLAENPTNGIRNQDEIRIGGMNIQNSNNAIQQATVLPAPDIGLNNNGVFVLDPAAPRNANNQLNNFNVYNNNDNNRIGNGQYPDNRAVQNIYGGNSQLNITGNSNYEQAQRNGSAYAKVASNGGPYRVALKPDQLQELVRDFRVAVIARGDEVHLIQTTGANAPVTADAKERSGLLQRAGFDQNAIAGTSLATRAMQPAAAGRMGVAQEPNTAQNAVRTPNEIAMDAAANKAVGGQAAAPTLSPAAPATAPAVRREVKPEDFVECVITMERAPGTPASQQR